MARSQARRRRDTSTEIGRVSQTVSRRLKQIEACRQRGETVKAYAERTGQSVYPFYEASREARRAGVLPADGTRKQPQKPTELAPGTSRRFVEAVVLRDSVAEVRKDAVAWRLRLPGGAVLEAATPLDAPALDRLLAAFGGKP